LAKNQVQVEIDPNHFFSQTIVFIDVITIYSQVNGTVVMLSRHLEEEDKSQKAEVGGQKSEGRSRNAEGRRPFGFASSAKLASSLKTASQGSF